MKIFKCFLSITLTLLIVLSTAPTIKSDAVSIDPTKLNLTEVWKYGDLKDYGDGYYSGTECPISGFFKNGDCKFIITPEGKVRMHGLKLDGNDSGCWGETKIWKIYKYNDKYDIVYFDMTGFKIPTELKNADDDVKSYVESYQALFYNKKKKCFQDKTLVPSLKYESKLDYSRSFFAGINMGDVNYDNRISTIDIVLIRSYSLDASSTSSINLIAADFNVDGNIDISDVAAMQRYIVKMDGDNNRYWKEFIKK